MGRIQIMENIITCIDKIEIKIKLNNIFKPSTVIKDMNIREKIISNLINIESKKTDAALKPWDSKDMKFIFDDP